MDVERIPYTNLESKKTQLQSEQSIFRSINTKLKTLENSLFELRSYNLNSSYKATASSSAIVATATSSAMPGNYKIEVAQKAINATAMTLGSSLVEAVRNGDFKIGELDFSEPGVDYEDASNSLWNKLKLGDEELSDDQLLNRVASYINANATGAGATVSMVKSQNSGDY